MAHGTDGELITYDATGAPANVAVGTSGQVLTSGGAGVAPTFQTAGGGADTSLSNLSATGENKVCQAWVNWNMATPAIADSHNISSITDLGVGDQRLNFTNNMANSTYVAVANGDAVNNWHGTETTVISVSTSNFRVIHKENNVSYDCTYTGATVFGD
jgi:hypothetical protein